MTITLNDNITTILVDFFDTLVERTCHPEVVKRKWAAALIDLYKITLSVEQLYKWRITIESALCDFSRSQGDDAEFRYIDMLDALYHELKTANIKANLPGRDGFIESCTNVEMSIELSVQKPILSSIEFLRREKQNNRKVYLLSDFYLDQNAIKTFAKENDFLDLFDGIFVSSQNKRTKKDGGAYDFIIRELGLDVNKTIMLGDNLHSDVSVPILKGLTAFHLPRSYDKYELNIKIDKDRDLLKNKLKNSLISEQFDYFWIGGAIYLFIRRLYWNLISVKANNVYFFSREGQFLQIAFDNYQSSLPEHFQRITSHYIYVSRRATYLPSLNSKLVNDTFNKLLSQYSSCSIANFISSINLDNHMGSLQEELPLVDFHKQYDDVSRADDFKLLLNNDLFKTLFNSERTLQYSYLKKYCDDTFLEKDDQKIYVVDVGWKGSIQDNLAMVTGRDLVGYYFGVLEGAAYSNNNQKYGLLFDHQWRLKTGADIFNEFRAGFEVFMSASHGSLQRYADDVNRFIYDNSETEIFIYNNFIKQFQSKTLEVFTKFSEIESKFSISDKEIAEVIEEIYFNGVLLPTKDECKMFASLKHYENFGVFNYSVFSDNKNSSLQYIKKIIKRPRFTIRSAWWKPLDFYNNRVTFLKYPYFLYKKVKSMRDV